MAPAVIDSACKGDVHKGAPFWALRFFKQLHPRLVRQAIPLAGIADDAGADDIFPGGLASAIARQHMVDIELATLKMFTAVLAGILIPFKDIEPRELDLLFWEALKEAEDDDSRNADVKRYCLQHPWLRIGDGKITPA